MKEEYVIVAEFTPAHWPEEAHRQSHAELNAVLAGVQFGLNGSRDYKVIVPNSQADKARELLRKARFKNGKVKVY